jgi:hypothetical protein
MSIHAMQLSRPLFSRLARSLRVRYDISQSRTPSCGQLITDVRQHEQLFSYAGGPDNLLSGSQCDKRQWRRRIKY